MKKFLFIFFLFSQINTFSQKSISFIEEYIDFEIDSLNFSVNGLYFFTNSSEENVAKIIAFPFGIQADSVEIINVYNFSHNKNLEYIKRGKNIFFKLNMEFGDTTAVNIHYKQPSNKENRYILLSTKTWEKPLEIAHYSLKVNDGIKIKEISISPDSLVGKMYYWRKQHFMPESDFIVQIE